jgi:crossover junction endodeoxyribonuclease RusA
VILTLPFPPSVNNLFVNVRKGRVRSPKYDAWATEAAYELTRQRARRVAGPVSLLFEFEEGRDKRKRDISNLVKAPEDLLVKFGIIAADDNTIVREIRLLWSDQVKGVRLTINPTGGKSK